MIRILIIENQPGVRKGLQMMLSVEEDINVVIYASDGQYPVDLMATLQPDIVLVDIDDPNSDGFSVVKTLYSKFPSIPIIVLSILDDALTRALAQNAGASEFVSKTAPTCDLVETIHRGALVKGTDRVNGK